MSDIVYLKAQLGDHDLAILQEINEILGEDFDKLGDAVLKVLEVTTADSLQNLFYLFLTKEMHVKDAKIDGIDIIKNGTILTSDAIFNKVYFKKIEEEPSFTECKIKFRASVKPFKLNLVFMNKLNTSCKFNTNLKEGEYELKFFYDYYYNLEELEKDSLHEEFVTYITTGLFCTLASEVQLLAGNPSRIKSIMSPYLRFKLLKRNEKGSDEFEQ